MRRQEIVQRFVDKTLADGKPRGRAMFVSNIPNKIFQALRKQGINLVSDQIFLPDNTILKYRNHPKAQRGAALPFKQFWKSVNISRNPKNIYVQNDRGKIIFILSSRAEKSPKVIKLIIDPFYKRKGETFCAITSIGVIEQRAMDIKDKDGDRKYKKVK